MPSFLTNAIRTLQLAASRPPEGDRLAALEQRVARAELLLWLVVLAVGPDALLSAVATAQAMATAAP